MWFPDERMDINKFVAVHIPSKSTYLQKFGFATAPASMFTGDEFAPIPKDKVSSIADMEAYDAMMAQKDLENENANSNGA